MARFKSSSLYLKDGQFVIWGTGDDASIQWNGSDLLLDSTISGVTPTQDYHLTRKDYVDGAIDTDITTHAALTDAHHAQSHGNGDHSGTYIEAAGVTYENLNSNGDVGTASTQVSQGDHAHAYSAITGTHGNEDHSSTFITSAGVTFENLDANGDIGVTGTTVASGNHTHTESDITDLQSYITTAGVTYEALNGNSDVGTGADQVAQGSHTHGGGVADHGREAIGDASSTVSVTFSDMGDTNYTISAVITNTTDSPASIYAYGVTAKSSTGFTVTLMGDTDSANYVLEWSILDD